MAARLIYSCQGPGNAVRKTGIRGMADPRLRQLTIKTGVVKRLAKERTVYGKEVLTEQKRLEKFASEGADEHVLKKQEEVIQECLMMLPDSIRRLTKEYEVLEKFLAEEVELKETKEYGTAAQVLAEAKEVIEKDRAREHKR